MRNPRDAHLAAGCIPRLFQSHAASRQSPGYGRFSAGLTCPRWHVVQFTIALGPLRFGMFLSRSLLIVATILLMSRAVCFCVLSSLSHSPGVWQCVQLTPSDLP